jgi:uncharacterized protein DUF6959
VRTELVEIYADTTNAAVLRHPGRNFPGVLVQGDTLYSLCQAADFVCSRARSGLDDESFSELNELRNRLWSFLTHYKSVLAEHQVPVPFNEVPRS